MSVSQEHNIFQNAGFKKMYNHKYLRWRLLTWRIHKTLTSRNEKSSPHFVKHMTAKRCSADDEETSQDRGDHSQEQENWPETTINWRVPRGKET